MKEDILVLKHIYKRFPLGEGEFTALKDLSLNMQAAEFSGLVGPSGSGKTTLLNIIGGLDQPSEGEAIVLGQDVANMSAKAAANFRNLELGFIFQQFNLLPVYTVFENVEFPLLLQKKSKAERQKTVKEALEWLGIAHLANKKPDKLSGGEGQRVAIARAIVKRPKLILADEPTANLDAANAHNIMRLMRRLNQELGTSFLFSTHDEKVMAYLERIIHLRDGEIEKDEAQIPKTVSE
ncbi:ABC-type antimicrobial peptide transport system, ATPase component [Saprospira grandis DSM 2844]|uniref:ABC-type antimicrobial peptide transport system, ATPase component n=1 Tax=Saprospira grandis DSM 2844 TaxID=694433 RepID=J0NXT8_9BACT|nr:ABC transporter ATP-binding protein [Saprospira grandis]EJF52329.1 ABC-type antimicrobial peptide transport system, ATPase component [Saprospira grandis DSM 2844]